MSRKVFWNGLGFGLIGGAVLLQLMLMAQNTATSAPVVQQSPPPAEIVESDKKYSQDEYDQKLQVRLKEEIDKRPLPEAPKPEQIKKTTVYISAGLNSDRVVEMFQRSGLISDAAAMSAEIKKRKLTASIRTGAHVFEGEPSMEELIEAIIRQP
ncbi:hypothetical protein NV379_05770 [Paenibacillus sp. N1-5-1-14]|uniref:hypothetical protein n=1 Tax=Paenibacillus radicibacter TaxID=2972488 RepID=UPI002158E504|nr:hypothetical protein [Paenibacillus radicibacter]MCR8642162.1 hypothetical protein [Paenibacillus radicibacter]